MSLSPSTASSIDTRGPRFSAWITSAVLVVVLVTASPVLLGAQAVVFALGAFLGLRFAPYGLLYRTVARPLAGVAASRYLLGPTGQSESAAPVRFAQGIGFVFAAAGTVALALGAGLAGLVLTGFALVAALLNASIGLCLGCEVFLRLPARLRDIATPRTDRSITA